MNEIIKVAEGAYFVPSYSDQTVLQFIPGITNQSIVFSPNLEEEITIYEEIPGEIEVIPQTK